MDNIATFCRRREFLPAVFFCLLLALNPPLRGAEADGPVVFCSYNLKNWLLSPRPGDAAEAPPQPKPEKEKAKVISTLTEIRPDILGVCEIGSLDDLKELQSRLKQAGIDLPHLEHSKGVDATRSLGLLSRFPIVSRHSQSLLEYQIGEATFGMQRGILDVAVDVRPDCQIRFVGVHLKSKRPIPEADEALMRRNEAHLLRGHLDKIFAADAEAKVLCYGDFNEHRNEPAISEIIGPRASPGYMSDLFLRDSHGLVWTHFWDAADVYGRLDYLFASRALRPWLDSRKSYIHTDKDFYKASDHRPIVTTLAGRRKSSAAAGQN